MRKEYNLGSGDIINTAKQWIYNDIFVYEAQRPLPEREQNRNLKVCTIVVWALTANDCEVYTNAW
jgi:hypothetical protein